MHDVMQAMQERFGTPTKLVDFERKAQMMDDVSYRAIFEGLNVNQWTRDSGRLLWMSLPAWPSTTWQVYSHDYDTQRILPAYYSDNDLNLPSGASREVKLSVEDGTRLEGARVTWRGWNVVPGKTPVSGKQNPTEAVSFVGCNSFVTNQPLVHGCHHPSTHGRG